MTVDRYRAVTAPWGDTLWIDTTDESHRDGLLTNGVSWGHEVALLRRLVRPGMVVVDVGAAYGYLTTLLASSVGPTGRVVAVEPAPAAFALLQRNIAHNGYVQVVTTVSAALTDASGQEATLHLDQHRHACHSLIAANLPTPGGSVRVPALTLDAVVEGAGLPRVDLVKLDVEGAEARVLAGGRRVLSELRYLWLEFWPEGLRAAGADPAGLLDQLSGLGFDLTIVDLVTGDSRPGVGPRAVLEYCADLAGSPQLADDPDPLYPLVYVLARQRG